MANDKNELNSVNWTELFGFTRIFKSFRLAMNVSALALGLAAIVLVWVTGSAMDRVASWTGQGVMENEIGIYARQDNEKFVSAKEKWEKGRPGSVADLHGKMIRQRRTLTRFTSMVANSDITNKHFMMALRAVVKEENDADDKDKPYKTPDDDALNKAAKSDWEGELDRVRDEAELMFSRIEYVLEKTRAKAADEVKKVAADKREDAESDLGKFHTEALRSLTSVKMEIYEATEGIRGRKIFDSFVTHEADSLKGAVVALLSGNVTGGLANYLDDDKAPAAASPAADDGFIVKMLGAALGVAWLFSQHWLFATILLVVMLAIWAVFGGAIHRIAAVQAARDEKISWNQAIHFSLDRVVGFFCAPLMPLAFIGVLGGLLMLGGLAVNIPYVGPLVVGLLFFIALLLGLAIAFLIIGLLGGAGLMFPTIAVEGSDAFDAMSRSFSYVLTRPWRTALYTVVAIIHGAICYTFVRVFAFIALKVTHFFVSATVWTGGDSLPGVAEPDKMDVLWAEPTLTTLNTCNWQAMGGGEKLGAALMMIWIYVIVGLVASFVLTYIAGASTSIYLLLRRKVDATDYDEVYVDEDDAPDFAAVTAPQEAEPVEADATAQAETPAKEEKEEEKKPAEATPSPDDDKADKADETGADEKTED